MQESVGHVGTLDLGAGTNIDEPASRTVLSQVFKNRILFFHFFFLVVCLLPFAGRRFGDRVGESSSLHEVCCSGLRLADVRLLQPPDCALQAHRRLVRCTCDLSRSVGPVAQVSRLYRSHPNQNVCVSCRSRSAEYDIVGGDHLGCHFSSILHSTGLQYRDFIYVSFHNQVDISLVTPVRNTPLCS